PAQGTLQDALARARLSHDEAEAALLAVYAHDVEHLLLLGQKCDVFRRKRVSGEPEMGADHGCPPAERLALRRHFGVSASGERHLLGRSRARFGAATILLCANERCLWARAAPAPRARLRERR